MKVKSLIMIIVTSVSIVAVYNTTAIGAGTCFWVDATGDPNWTNPDNWSPSPPGAGDWAIIGHATCSPGNAQVNSAVGGPRGLSLGLSDCNGLLTVGPSGNISFGESVKVGDGGTGTVTQTGGYVRAAIEGTSYLSIGESSGSGGTYDISGGTLYLDNELKVVRGVLKVSGDTTNVFARKATFGGSGGSGMGILRVTTTLNPSAITFREGVRWCPRGRLEVDGPAENPEIHIGGNWVMESTDKSDFDDLKLINLVFDESGTFEVAGLIDGGFTNNFALGGLEVSDGFALQLVNLYNNGNGAAECLFAEELNIYSSASLDVFGHYMYLSGNQADLLNSWIADGRLFSSLGPIEAVYMPDYNWTVVPEPTTVILLSLGALTLLRQRKA